MNAEFDNIVDDYNGSIKNANIASDAAIASTKISGTAVTLTGTETLTNKTLTSPTLQGTLDGWISANETWTYASATTITVPSGAANKYKKGDKLKLTQTTAKYFYVTAVADTTLTVTGGSDYTVANATITSPYYSHTDNPIGFPDWFNWTVTHTGFSADPTYTAIFCIKGETLFFQYTVTANGTSGGDNGAKYYITIPVQPATTATWNYSLTKAVNNGSTLSTHCRANHYGTVIALINIAGADANDSWTTSGEKAAWIQGFYEI